MIYFAILPQKQLLVSFATGEIAKSLLRNNFAKMRDFRLTWNFRETVPILMKGFDFKNKISELICVEQNYIGTTWTALIVDLFILHLGPKIFNSDSAVNFSCLSTCPFYMYIYFYFTNRFF